MIEHPWTELQVLIKEKWLTQKAFSSILWKKVSEVNELLKWKRNITIQRDYLLHQTLWTPMKYWILKQVDYDYSLLDIEESSNSHLPSEEKQSEIYSHQASHSEQSEESSINNLTSLDSSTSLRSSLNDNPSSSWASAKDLRWETNESNTQDSSSLLSSEWQKIDDEDLKNRANIFRSF